MCKELASKAYLISGVLYLHRIIDERLYGSSKRGIQLFIRICGLGAMSSVRILTTQWGLLQNWNEGIAREQQFRRGPWKIMVDHGAVVEQFDGHPEGARKISKSFERATPRWLRVQEQMIWEHLFFINTDVGSEVLAEAERLSTRQQGRENIAPERVQAQQQLHAGQIATEKISHPSRALLSGGATKTGGDVGLEARVSQLESKLQTLEKRVEICESSINPPHEQRFMGQRIPSFKQVMNWRSS